MFIEIVLITVNYLVCYWLDVEPNVFQKTWMQTNKVMENVYRSYIKTRYKYKTKRTKSLLIPRYSKLLFYADYLEGYKINFIAP